MNSNFHQNSYRNFNSDYFQLIPSKFITFGESPKEPKVTRVIDSSSNRHENNIIFRQMPSNHSNTFKFDLEKSFIKNNNNQNLTPLVNKEIISIKDDPIYFKNSFQMGSKTILNSINTCLLNLCSPQKKIKKSNTENESHIDVTNHLINQINEEFISDTNNNNNKNISNSLMEKIKFSPLHKMLIIKKENNSEVNTKIKTLNLSEINYQNIPDTQNLNNPQNKYIIQGAFKSMNNKYENPAKIQSQFNQPFMMPMNQNFLSNNIPNITQISNITNVTNNYYFQCDNQKNFLKRKTKRVQTIKNDNLTNYTSINKNKDNIINNKTPKKDNLSYGLYQLNQISVNGISISKFPVVSMNEDDLEIQLLSKMLTETDYFTIVDKYYINIPVLDEEKYNRPSYDKVFKKEKEKINNLYLIGDNINENNPVKLIKNYYLQIKDKILNIQKNYISNNKKSISLNNELCIELEKLIISCNAITNLITDYKKSGLKRKLFLEKNDEDDKNKNNLNNNINKEENKELIENKKENNNILNENKDKDLSENNNNLDNNNNSTIKKQKQKIKHFKTYLCEFCNKAYSNGQGLGGHMSRIHPNQSYKYKDKIRIRREREKKRERLLNIKQALFKKYGYDYDKLVNDKNKTFIQRFLLEHNEEYKNIRKNQKENKNNENISENHENTQFKNFNIFVTPLPAKINCLYEKKINYKEGISHNYSKEKTNDKTEYKINENKNMEYTGIKSKNGLGFEKLKINFELNKS